MKPTNWIDTILNERVRPKVAALKFVSQTFSKYVMVGILNTAIHWLSFLILFEFLATQSTSNFVAFLIAVTFSFFINSKFTFKSKRSFGRYVSFITFMSMVSFLTGYMADKMALPIILTLVIFSSLSLVCGYYYSKFFVFTEAPT